jgi:hypothetical protein
MILSRWYMALLDEAISLYMLYAAASVQSAV